jgi:hypothetical protein
MFYFFFLFFLRVIFSINACYTFILPFFFTPPFYSLKNEKVSYDITLLCVYPSTSLRLSPSTFLYYFSFEALQVCFSAMQ